MIKTRFLKPAFTMAQRRPATIGIGRDDSCLDLEMAQRLYDFLDSRLPTEEELDAETSGIADSSQIPAAQAPDLTALWESIEAMLKEAEARQAEREPSPNLPNPAEPNPT